MKRQVTSMILMVAVLIVMPFQAYAASAKEIVETGVNKVIKTLADSAFKAKPRDVKITEIGNIIGEVFDLPNCQKEPWAVNGRKWMPRSRKNLLSC